MKPVEELKMKMIVPKEVDWQMADPRTFSGQARVKRLGGGDEPDRTRLYWVEFAASSRTHWHEHTGVQLLYVVKGTCQIQKWGEPLVQVEAGGVVLIEPGEKHWHGAGGEVMSHLAVNINADTRWLEAVGTPPE